MKDFEQNRPHYHITNADLNFYFRAKINCALLDTNSGQITKPLALLWVAYGLEATEEEPLIYSTPYFAHQ